MPDLLTLGGVVAAVSVATAWLVQTLITHRFAARIAAIESQLSTQSTWMSARLTRTDERRSLALSRLHTRLDRALRITELFVGSHDAGNPDSHTDNLRITCIRAWNEFDQAFERAEIFLSAEIAERIRTYGNAIADARVGFETTRWKLDSNAELETRLVSVGEALRKLSELKSDVRPQLVKEIRAALGADAIDIRRRTDH